MTEIEVLLDNTHSFFEQTLNEGMPRPGSMKECSSILALGTREERTALLKAGFTGKAIESQYLRLNSFIVIGVNWQDSP